MSSILAGCTPPPGNLTPFSAPPRMKPERLFSFPRSALAALLLPATAGAMIVYDGNSNSNSYNTSAPSTPGPFDPTLALWNHVVEIRKPGGDPDASGVYLGGGYILTANHVTGTRYFIQGTEYRVDPSFGVGGSVRISNSASEGLDLKVVKILSPPGLPGIELLTNTSAALGSYSVFSGFGVGKGAPQPGDPATQGWTWGESSTATQRWGRNFTLFSTSTFLGNPNIYLVTRFNPSVFSFPAAYNNDVYGATVGDSGGGLFQLDGGVWKLAGIAAAVSVNGSSFYDRDLSSAGNQSDATYYVSIPAYYDRILAVIPEPSTASLLAAAWLTWALTLGRRSRQSRA